MAEAHNPGLREINIPGNTLRQFQAVIVMFLASGHTVISRIPGLIVAWSNKGEDFPPGKALCFEDTPALVGAFSILHLFN